MGYYVKVLGIERGKHVGVGDLLKVVVQVVLFFGSETWVMNPHTRQSLGGFHHRVDRCITGRQPWWLQDRNRESPLLEETIWEAGL